MQAINTITALIMMSAAGYFAARFKMTDENFPLSLARIITNITLPCMIISSMQVEVDPSMASQFGILIIASFATAFLGLGIGWLFGKISGAHDAYRRIAICAAGFSNFGFMGFPVVNAVYGAEGMFAVAIYTLPCFAMVHVITNIVLNDKEEFHPRMLMNPPTAAVLIGLIPVVFSFKLPAILTDCLNLAGVSTTPMAMFLAGTLIVNTEFKTLFHNWRHLILSVIRLIAIPAVVFFVLKSLGLEGTTLGVPVLISMMPVAANVIINAAYFGCDAESAAQLTLMSTILSAITIPVMISILGI